MAVVDFLRRGRKKLIDPEKLLLKQYGLSKWERVEMLVRGAILSQFAVPIGSALYFLWFQMRYVWSYQRKDGTTATFINISLKDTWDRLPIHIDNLLNRPIFAPLGTVHEPAWWVVARHDFRKVLIGVLVTVLVGAIKVGFKKYKPASTLRMVLSVPLAFIGAIATAAVLIVLFRQLPTVLTHFGTSENITYISDWLGKGQIELLVIGILAGLVANRILARTFATLQTLSIERNIAQGDTIHGIKMVLYGANYRKRWAYIKHKVDEEGYEARLGSKWLGIMLVCVAPVLPFLLYFGVWLLYLGGPASH